MTTPAERYTDQDLRRDPRLIGIAICYARDYDGDFAPMLDARDEAIRTGSLPLPIARVVLNCMRFDYEAYEILPDRPTRPTPRIVQDAEDTRKAHPSKVRREPKPKKEQRTYVLRTEVKPKYHYGMTAHKTKGRVLHYVAEAWCDWEKYDYQNDKWRNQPVPKFKVRWACQSLSNDKFVLVKSDYELPDGGYCRSGCWETDRLTELWNGRWIQPRE